MNEPFPKDIVWSQFDQNTDFETLLDSIEKRIDVINDNDGWTLIGCSKRGEINDVAFKHLLISSN